MSMRNYNRIHYYKRRSAHFQAIAANHIACIWMIPLNVRISVYFEVGIISRANRSRRRCQRRESEKRFVIARLILGLRNNSLHTAQSGNGTRYCESKYARSVAVKYINTRIRKVLPAFNLRVAAHIHPDW